MKSITARGTNENGYIAGNLKFKTQKALTACFKLTGKINGREVANRII